MDVPETILSTLEAHDQQHLIRWWDGLTEPEQQALLRQIEQIDFPLVDRLIALRSGGETAESGAARAARASAPEQLVRLPQSDVERERRRKAAEAGEALLREGRVGAILVAGGQGTRLGFDQPKGMFPIGPVSDRTLFQVLCEQLMARSRRAGRPIPYFIMTSEATHAPTVRFFEQQQFFGLNPEDVYFFQQASLPAIDDASPRILLESRGRIATSPDGHGGLLNALKRHGLLEVMRERGIEHLFYHQVDNPTAILCDPECLGLHLEEESEMTTKVVAKTGPEEKMGVLATIDGRTEIIEYSDLPPEQARRTQPDGTFLFWAGNTAIHLFRRTFLERLLEGDHALPFHVAHKQVACLDEGGNRIEPKAPNAHKFEQFIFDALPRAHSALVVEADREREFNPVKNAEGNDSPATAQAALNRIARAWIEQAGGTVEAGVQVEISPWAALDERELAERLGPGQRFLEDAIISGPG
jgi:UDP-N-acetylglucosamine/UDP-N-acetylgalactosamine diphosphorylase